MEDHPVPPELQWENMEAGIFRKMEALQATAPAEAEKRRRRWGVIVLLLLGVLVSITLLFDSQDTAKSTEVPTPPSAQTVDGFDTSVANDIPATAHSHAGVDGQVIRSNRTAEAGENAAQDSEEQTIAVSGSNQRSSELEMVEDASQKPITPEVGNTPIAEGANKNLKLKRGDEHYGPTEAARSSTTLPLQSVAQLLDADIINPVVSQEDHAAGDLPASALVTPVPRLNRKATSTQMWLTGGASWWAPGYGNTQPERSNFEQAILSYQGQLSYVQPLKGDLILLAGIQYQRLESRLNWNTTIDEYEIILEDTVIQIRRNAVTGEETEIRGDARLTVPAERRVQHFNSLSLLQVPIGIGKTWGNGRWQSHLLVAAVVNFSFTREGRMVYQSELVDYSGSSLEFWSDKLGFSAMLSGGLRYRITDRLGLMTMLQYQHSLSNWSTEAGITMRPHMLNWSFGASYSL